MRTDAQRHGWRTAPSRLLAVLAAGLLLALTLTLALPVTTATAASTGCSVKNKATGRTYSTLQRAVNAAQPRQTLLVRGTCRT